MDTFDLKKNIFPDSFNFSDPCSPPSSTAEHSVLGHRDILGVTGGNIQTSGYLAILVSPSARWPDIRCLAYSHYWLKCCGVELQCKVEWWSVVWWSMVVVSSLCIMRRCSRGVPGEVVARHQGPRKKNCPGRFVLWLILSTRVRKYYLVNFATKKHVLCLWHRQVIK